MSEASNYHRHSVLLCMCCVAALSEVTSSGETLLHASVRNTTGIATQLAHALVELNPELLLAEDHTGRTALTVASAAAVDPELLQWLAKSGVPVEQHAAAAAVFNHHNMVRCVRELTVPTRLTNTMRVSEMSSPEVRVCVCRDFCCESEPLIGCVCILWTRLCLRQNPCVIISWIQAKQLRKVANQKRAHEQLLQQISNTNQNYDVMDCAVVKQLAQSAAKELSRVLHDAERLDVMRVVLCSCILDSGGQVEPDPDPVDWRMQMRCHVRGVYSSFNSSKFAAACRVALEQQRLVANPEQYNAKIGVHATSAMLGSDVRSSDFRTDVAERSSPGKESAFWVMLEVWGHADDPATVLMQAGLLDGFKVLEAY